MNRGATPGDDESDIVALRWLERIGRGRGNNPAFLTRRA